MLIAAQRQIAILLPLLLATTVALACTSGDEPPPAVGFYAEVAIEVEHAPDSPGARFGSAEPRHAIRWWYARDPARWRWEMEIADAVINNGVVVTVANGGDSWEYDDRSNTYQRGIVAGAQFGPIFSVPVGPAHAESIDALIQQWRARTSGEVGLAGEATLLGRRVQIVEIRHSSDEVIRAFVDPERMFIMRSVVDGADGVQSYRAEVTALDYDTELDAGLFTLERPPGAREVVALPLKRPVCGIPPAPRRSGIPRRARLPQPLVHAARLRRRRCWLRGRRHRRLRSGSRLRPVRIRGWRLHPVPPAPPSRRCPPGGALLATRRRQP